MTAGETLTHALNRVAGTLNGNVPTLEAQGAANVWAGTTGLAMVGALNIKAGNELPAWLDAAGVLNQLAGTTGLDVDGAASHLSAGGAGGSTLNWNLGDSLNDLKHIDLGTAAAPNAHNYDAGSA